MYAIVKTGGHQYKVQVGDQLDVEKLPAAAGEQIELNDVLMVSGDDDSVQIGNPLLTGARVMATVVNQHRGEKSSCSNISRRNATAAKWAIARISPGCPSPASRSNRRSPTRRKRWRIKKA